MLYVFGMCQTHSGRHAAEPTGDNLHQGFSGLVIGNISVGDIVGLLRNKLKRGN